MSASVGLKTKPKDARRNQWSALHFACSYNYNVQVSYGDGFTRLDSGNPCIIELLLDFKADIYSVCESGETPLDVCYNPIQPEPKIGIQPNVKKSASSDALVKIKEFAAAVPDADAGSNGSHQYGACWEALMDAETRRYTVLGIFMGYGKAAHDRDRDLILM